MGCYESKKKIIPDDFYCSFHKKNIATYFCLLPSCATCSKKKFSLCNLCAEEHKTSSEGLDLLYLQQIIFLNSDKINYNKHYISNIDEGLIKSLEMILLKKKKKEISIIEFLEQIYLPLQNITKLSILEKEKEKEMDYEMLNSLNISIGSIQGDGKVLDEANTITHYFSESDCSIKKVNGKIIAYYYDTGIIVNSLSKTLGIIELSEEGANILDYRRMKIGSISNEGVVLDEKTQPIGICKAAKIKVAYEYFFYKK